MSTQDALTTLFVVLCVAALTPVVVALLPGPRIPQVVIFLIAGVLIGPEVLSWGNAEGIELFADVGLGFLFLLAGYEVDPDLVRTTIMKRAGAAWAVSAVLSLAVTGVLFATGIVNDYLAISIALTTTALGTILPIVRDAGMLGGPLGKPILANGAVGEFLPIIAISLFLGSTGQFIALATLIFFGLMAFLVVWIPRRFVPMRVMRIIAGGTEATSQSTLRWVVVLLVGLLLIASDLGLDIILGAFAAGVVLRLSRPRDIERLEHKLDAIGYGFFIPIYFIVSGMKLDIASILASPERCILFFVLLLAVRGGAVFLVHRSLPVMERGRLALLAATALPLLVALSQIGIETGLMLEQNAAALVGAGVLSVLIFPLVATRGLKQSATPPAEVKPETN